MTVETRDCGELALLDGIEDTERLIREAEEDLSDATARLGWQHPLLASLLRALDDYRDHRRLHEITAIAVPVGIDPREPAPPAPGAEWRPCVGLRNYEVSDQGQVRERGSRVLTPWVDQHGLRVKLRTETGSTGRYVARLVAAAFLDVAADARTVTVEPRNGNPRDCRLANLEIRERVGKPSGPTDSGLSSSAEATQHAVPDGPLPTPLPNPRAVADYSLPGPDEQIQLQPGIQPGMPARPTTRNLIRFWARDHNGTIVMREMVPLMIAAGYFMDQNQAQSILTACLINSGAFIRELPGRYRYVGRRAQLTVLR